MLYPNIRVANGACPFATLIFGIHQQLFSTPPELPEAKSQRMFYVRLTGQNNRAIMLAIRMSVTLLNITSQKSSKSNGDFSKGQADGPRCFFSQPGS
jgi:hypothetical protein